MKRTFFLCISILFSITVFAQTENVKLTSTNCKNEEVQGLLEFQKIQYNKSVFSHKDLRNKFFKLKLKDIRNGKKFADSIIFDSKKLGLRINDSIFTLKIYAKATKHHKLRMQMNVKRLAYEMEFDLTEKSTDYALRNVAAEGKFPIQFGKPFYFLGFITPYDLGSGIKSFREVANDTKNIEKWGEKYKLKQYLLFELVFED